MAFNRVATFDIYERKASPSGLKRFPATISTETPVSRRDPWTGKPYDEVLSHAKGAVDLSRAPLPLIESHDRTKVNVGVVENLRLDGTRLRGDVVLGNSQRAQELAADIEAGIVTGLSVGYSITKDEFDESVQRQTATRWQIYEVSIVSVPADTNAGIGRSSTMAAEKQSKTIDLGAEERERVAGIKQATRGLGASGPDVAERLIESGATLEQARAQVIEALAARSDATRIDHHLSSDAMMGTRSVSGGVRGSGVEMIDDATDKFIRGASAWIFERTGQTALIERAKQKNVKGFEKVETDGGEYRGMSFLDLSRESLERRGVRTRGMSRLQLAGMALTHRSGGYAPASDFGTLLESALHKVLLGAYKTTPDTWKLFAKTDTVQDFRESGRYRVGSFGAMDVVAENAEYTNKSIPDGAKTLISTETRGNMIGISRQAIINDDMSSMADLAARFGRGAALSIEKAVYALLAQNSGLGPTMSDSLPFFDSSRGNVNGTGSALSVAGLDADRVIMAAQQDISSNEVLDLKPFTILVSSSNGGEARVLNTAAFDNDGTKLMKPNKVVGLFTNVVDSARLSGNRRYLFTDPGVAAAIVVAFLEGTGEAPFLEQQLGWRVDGTEYKCRIDFKAQMFDPKGAVTNAGQ